MGDFRPGGDHVGPRFGGRFETLIVNSSGGSTHLRAVFDEVDAPHILSWTESDFWISTTITFTGAVADRTAIRIHQRRVPDATREPDEQSGVKSSLDRFERYLRAGDRKGHLMDLHALIRDSFASLADTRRVGATRQRCDRRAEPGSRTRTGAADQDATSSPPPPRSSPSPAIALSVTAGPSIDTWTDQRSPRARVHASPRRVAVNAPPAGGPGDGPGLIWAAFMNSCTVSDGLCDGAEIGVHPSSARSLSAVELYLEVGAHVVVLDAR